MTTTEQLGLEAVTVDRAGDDDLTLWSVTTILGALDKPALLYWSAQQAAEAAIDNLATWQAMLEDRGRAEAVKWLRDARFRRPRNLLAATDLGTITHKMCEEYALTGVRPDKERIAATIRVIGGEQVDVRTEGPVVHAMLDQFDGWLQRFTPSYQATEVCVYSPTYGYAGQTDGFLTIDGVRSIIDYKGLDRSTPLATPDGWTTIGAVAVGDRIFGTTGRPVKVTAKSEVHQRSCYRVTFDDTSSIVCDDEHLWSVVSTYDQSSKQLRTDEIPGELRSPATGQRHLAIPLPGPLDLPTATLPVDPYVYGCWLGDGTRKQGIITKPDDALFNIIRSRGYQVGNPIGGGISRTVYGLRRALRRAGLLGHRTIPQVYLRAAIPQRLDLLRGLMDTDGSWNGTRSQAVFSTVDKHTAHTVHELVTSLGERPLINTIQAHGFGLDVIAYQVTWRPQRHNPFSLPRKADRVQLGRGRSWRRLIVSVEPTITVPTQCITVDAPDGCFLAGPQMVATHNTSRDPYDSKGQPRTPYPEQVGLQLAAYRNAEFAAVWRPRRTEQFKRRYYLLSDAEREMAQPVPQVDGGLCIQITPESCEAYPIRCDAEVHRAFLFTIEVFRWLQQTSKTAMGATLESPGDPT